MKKVVSIAAIGAAGTALLVTPPVLAAPETGLVEGTVFRDHNQSGVQDTGEPGRDGIEVRAYDDFGNVAGPAASGADGTYSLALTGLDDSNGSRYRVEFTIPTAMNFLQSGPVPDSATAGTIRNGSSVQFAAPTGVVVPGAAGIDFGVANPGDFCGSQPAEGASVVLTCFVDGRNGVPSGPDYDALDTIISFDHDAPVAKTVHGTSGQTGATWGLAYRDASSTVFTSAITKRHTKYGSGGGPSSIWAFDPTDTGTAPSEFLNLDAVLADSFTNPRTAPVDYLRDPDVWGAVGTTGLGDLDISDDETTLYTVDLEHKKLIEIPVGAQGATVTAPTAEGDASAGAIDSFAIPSPCGANGVAGAPSDMRPWAVDVHDGLVYVGMVCSGESTVDTDPATTYYRTTGNMGETVLVDFQGSITNDSAIAQSDPYPWADPTGANKLGDWHSLSAHVFTFDPVTEAFSAAPVMSMDLDYERGYTFFVNSSNNARANWNPWVPQWTAKYPSANGVTWSQPILADIDFDGDDMLLAFNDRGGHQFGQVNFNTDPASTLPLGVSHSAPELLRACTTDRATWTLESNSACPLAGGFAATAGADTGQGPGTGAFNAATGRGEFFFEERYNNIHYETASTGGIMQVPGAPQVLTTSYDFSTVNQGSVEWFNNVSGEADRGYSVYVGKNPTFGKAAGLGDIEVLCAAAPVQIGNLVWFDADGDGIQDPSEPAIPGVTVTLVDSMGNAVGAPIMTDANGEWYFDIAPNTAYSVQFDLTSVNPADLPTGVTVADLALTLQDAGTNGNDTRDSDGYLNTGVLTIDVAPHLAGHNDHTFDIGFNVQKYDLALIKTVAPAGPVAPGSTVVWTVRVENQGDVTSGDFTVTDTLPTGLTYVSSTIDGSAVTPTQAGQILTYTATDLPDLASGESTAIAITTTVSDVTMAPFRNWAEISSDSGDDEDSTPDTDTGSDTGPGLGTGPTGEDVVNHNDPNFDSDSDTPLSSGDDEDDNDFEDIDVGIVYDLALVKTTPAPVVDLADSIVWDIRVRNQGNVRSGSFTVTDTIPSGLSFGSASNGGTESGGIVTWTISDLAPATTLDLSYITTISNAAAAPFRNWAEISSDSADTLYGVADKDSTPDTNTGADTTLPNDNYVGIDDLGDVNIDQVTGDEDDNDDATVSLNVIYDLALAKTTPVLMVGPADTIVWNIRVRNQGNVPAGAFSVTDTMPTGLAFVSADTGGAESGGVVTWAIADLAAGASIDLSYSTTITDGSLTSFRNWAEISSDSADTLYGVADKDSIPDTNTGADTTLPNDNYVGIDDLGDVNIDQVEGDEDDNDDAAVTVNGLPLPATGSDSNGLLRLGLLVMVAGVALVLGGRRRFTVS